MSEARDWGVLPREDGTICFRETTTEPTGLVHHRYSAETTIRRAAASTELLHGVPVERMDKSDQAVAMFIAFLKGDDLAALAGAEDIFERAQNGGYVPRSEIVKANGTLAAMVGELRKELRHVNVQLNYPNKETPAPRTVVYDYEIILALLHRIDAVLAKTKKGDPQ